MKTNVSIRMTDDDRARVRAALGRGGLATREEIRIFVDRAIVRALAQTPEPKRRRPKPAPAPTAAPMDPSTPCATCGKTLADHYSISKTCPLNRTTKPGARFVPQPRVEEVQS